MMATLDNKTQYITVHISMDKQLNKQVYRGQTIISWMIIPINIF
jgi:hypothetical protein